MATELTRIEIDCSVFGQPDYSAQFFKDLMKVDNTKGIGITYNESMIENMTIEDDGVFVGFNTLFSTWCIPCITENS